MGGGEYVSEPSYQLSPQEYVTRACTGDGNLSGPKRTDDERTHVPTLATGLNHDRNAWWNEFYSIVECIFKGFPGGVQNDF
eukprot:CAMPEP_0174895734 /NCGR_PEP_ID=MMETSP0167-20121228/10070_1 /TAXON_ID=38298 /ORGANISM="Rhodella maculata, Strain CCMP736" /LENGTH=80 /DNA_ID=CAMNT_0016135133 /DNA_START=98 /DNA_END=340 /DNA_ORIENTATION=+